ncbi:uncharacterized protein LOC121244787 [Juglans microcarpa x Juglans regia]|uniref:uncharacterized protein LOC121244787 n=1 Tax=Juglans microcarpa x Juglans regia TaxID=2249226 RepID=UPI001B7E4FBC|nr:uncharacterized protein LOC121244787 [Juglans microcarpa x Juglans regia]
MVRTVEVPTVGIEVMTIQPGTPDEAASIVRYLETGKVSEDRQKVRKVRNRAARYTMIEGVLYRQDHSAPLLRCISPKEAQYMLAEIQEGICGNHSEGRTLVGKKMMRVDYYWLQALRDAKSYSRKC